MPDDAYDGHFFAGLKADVWDRLGGRVGRANARLGFIRAPEGSGRAIWIKTDGEEWANRLAVDLAAAVRERRRDVRLVVTFEQEYSDVLTRLAQLPRTGYGFGPADRVGATNRVVGRLTPLGVIAVGRALRPTLAARLSAQHTPCVLVHGVPPGASCQCWGLANTARERGAWEEGRFDEGALLSLTAVAQVEPVFQGLAGAHARALFWVTDLSCAQARALATVWKASPWTNECLLFLGARPDAAPSLSEWDRERAPLPPGSIVWVDEERFWPALAASATATHMQRPKEALAWAAMAGGRHVTIAKREDLDLLSPPPLPEVSWPDLLGYWERLLHQPLASRGSADALRRFFWNERRRAAAAIEALLQRVYAW